VVLQNHYTLQNLEQNINENRDLSGSKFKNFKVDGFSTNPFPDSLLSD